ncbi:E3 ubiquitin-protein ligase MARCHF4-like isoform X1 [Carassius gibelio]|uniref:E3 ubiquitin-protein ligase MARCHF4-like isoform X1 n=1 Tax=Carassius gibelio TaxID=101364 RepID=UPI002277485F|nr:E3 ubiquitin-protein ligase MARCHF4-like isoform X1 [Carassius gibelio]XP_052463045.1 E3 ubiquitin-protein ligase MARCHF4-like isoform X1 [Carassius gibelio]
MLRGHGMLKSRYCVLFSDLKVFLLGPQAPTNPMSGQTARISPYAKDNNNTLRAHRLRDWSAPSTEEEAADGCAWTGAAAEEFPKDRRDDRFSFISYAEGTPVCRICFQGPEQFCIRTVQFVLLSSIFLIAVIQTEISISDLLFRLMGELLSPCRCSGSVRSTHQPCLIKWISERGSWACELCYYKYQVIAISTKNPLQWQAISLTVIEKVQIAAAILGSLFLIASISWLVWSSLSPSAKWQRQDMLFQICYGMYGFMDVVCIALIIHEGPSVFRIFHRWQAVNQQWKVLNYDKKQDSEEQKNNEEWTRSLLHQREPAGADVSPSPSSLMAAAGTPTLTNITADAQNSFQTNALAEGPALPDQHCPYNLLHLLSHLRPHEARSPATNISTNTTKPREVVMRVTTV